jgi:hypothetical protein
MQNIVHIEELGWFENIWGKAKSGKKVWW